MRSYFIIDRSTENLVDLQSGQGSMIIGVSEFEAENLELIGQRVNNIAVYPF